LLRTPKALLYTGVIAFSVLGVYALSFNQFDLIALFFFGLFGYLMERYGFPAATLVLAMVLGPLVEQNLSRALNISGGDLTAFVERPISLALVITIFLLVVLPAALRMIRFFRAGRADQGATAAP
ncbi:MAG: tripartite tricarboxylate transporter permease, partial [Nocardioidaceae bacterium]